MSPRTAAEAWALFDAAAPVRVHELLGEWRGDSFASGHELDGLLERFGWYGKRFRDVDQVDPLLFGRGTTHPFAVSPRLMPLGLTKVRAVAQAAITPTLFRWCLPLLRTNRAAARLRTIEYRGVLTATMIYDHLPIHDVFRRLDDGRVLGVMDQRDAVQPFFFVLTPAAETTPAATGR
jgi:hypothetical protein